MCSVCSPTLEHSQCRPLLCFRWHDIANMSHNKSFFALELANKEETIQFQTVSKNEESGQKALLKRAQG